MTKMRVEPKSPKLSIFRLNMMSKIKKDAIVSTIKAELKVEEEKQDKDKAEVTPFAQFDSKGMFARKRVKGRNFSYEFGRLSKEIQDELDKVIEAVLGKQ